MSDNDVRRVAVSFEVSLGNRTIEAQAAIPDVPLTVSELLPVLRSFDDAFLSMVISMTEEQGRAITCRAGCGACCRQLPPISEPEAYWLAELVESFPEERRARVKARFAAALEKLRDAGMLDRLWELRTCSSVDERREAGLEYFRLGIACPFLEEESCSIHDQRPLSCREYLVTSPAVHCQSPTAETIQRIDVMRSFSEYLYRFGDGIGNAATAWLPLILALEWVRRQDGPPVPAYPGPQLFRNFVKAVTE